MGRYTAKPVDEAAEIQRLLTNANSIMYPATDLEAKPWLLQGAMGDSFWVVKDNGRNKKLTVYFTHALPDGTDLCDPCNRQMLYTVQQTAAMMRNNPMGYGVKAQRWGEYVATSLQVCSWLVLYEGKYEPRKYGFMRLDDNALTNLMSDLSLGSWTEALQYIPRIIQGIHTLTHSQTDLTLLLNTPLDLPLDFVKDAVQYFSDKKWYTTARQRSDTKVNGALSRNKLGELIGCESHQLHHDPKIRVFLRQFEPALSHPKLLINASPQANYHNQNTTTLAEAKNHRPTKKSLKDQINQLSAIFTSHNFLPQLIPPIKINAQEAILTLKANTNPSKHHNTLGLGIGLHLLQQACKWVVLYGDSIVNACIFYAKEIKQYDSLDRSSRSRALDKLYKSTCDTWFSTEIEGMEPRPLTTELNIKYRQLRATRSIAPDAMSFHQVVEGYIGACATLIGMLKPIRESELAHLARDSLLLSTFVDGLWLEHLAGKKGTHGINPLIQRPIPSIVGQAIGQLQHLGENLKVINQDSSAHADELFYFPSTKYFPFSEGKYLKQRVARAMDTFCDIVETPVDDVGRRWYVRVHELRRFFIHTIYRHETSHVLDAIGWYVGHGDAEHTKAYYEDTIRGEELQGYEAESVASRLIEFGANRLDEGINPGTATLYKKVCEIHNVKSLSGVSADDYHDTVKRMLAAGEFSIQHYMVGLQAKDVQDMDIEIAIIVGNKADEKAN
ncbi:hypothetical protein [Pseudomonas sp. G2-4]|uniref:hypothetical protein n=1 Tax=Pseudomonas sp. G2-4 TaxID=1506334 RepID=UPI0024B8F0C0|nr:hypothetical protein [Pseudomonas sp. G2-4]WHS59795.1 hypothetical protein QNH97_25790 [Pseudomonas sp. G2-4]